MTALDITFPARDGYRLAGTLYEPKAENGVVVLIGSATSIPRGYYCKFANFLCAQGFTVLTHDFRDTGGSVDPHWKGRTASYRAWAEEDMAGAIDWLRGAYPGVRLICIGHSGAGAIFGLVPNNWRVQGLLAVGAPYAYWGHWDRPDTTSKIRMWLLSHVLLPLATHILGHYPGWFLGAAKWPKGVALEWARWARNPHFFVNKRGQPLRKYFRSYEGKVRFYSFSDDLTIAPPHAVANVAGLYSKADVEVLYRKPRDYINREIGHYGFFRSAMQRTAWVEVVEWLNGFKRNSVEKPESIPVDFSQRSPAPCQRGH